MSARRPPLASVRDLWIGLGMVAVAPIAWIAPASSWTGFANALAWSVERARPRRTREQLTRIGRSTDGFPDMPAPTSIYRASLTGRIEQMFQYLREVRPGSWGWTPDLEVEGQEHLEEAQEKRRGVILWVAPFFSSDLVVKKALHGVGVRLVHLSIDDHGPSSSRLGRLTLNRVHITGESRYVDERIVMRTGSELAALRQLERRLRENRVVSIRTGPTGRRVVEASLLGGRITTATGAPSLALATGAPLLPTFALRAGSDAYRVRIEAPLRVPEAVGRRQAVDDLVRQFLARLEPELMRHPARFSAWSRLAPGSA